MCHKNNFLICRFILSAIKLALNISFIICFLYFKGKIHLAGVSPVDVEDIAIGPSSDATRDFLYFGDVGNNKRNRKEIYIYKFVEPKISQIR